MAGKMRIHELAKELGKSSREIVSILNEMGIPAISHANTIDDEEIARVKEKISASQKPVTKLVKKKKEEEVSAPSRTIKSEQVEAKEKEKEGALLEAEKSEEAVALLKEPVAVEIKVFRTEDTFVDYSAALVDDYVQPKKEEIIITIQEKPEIIEEVKAPVIAEITEAEKPRRKKKGRKKEIEDIYVEEEIIAPLVITEIKIPEGITLRDLAQRLGVKSKHILKRLLEKGYLININQSLSGDLAVEIASDFGCQATVISYEEEVLKAEEKEGREENLQPRPPVVTFMGHVDHGKTTLLDFIRKTNVAAKEVGGITQKIGAYKVFVNDKIIVFLDTPGHEAFTRIRARGAKATDMVILVVAADDGVMPQTIEAINHSVSAGTPIMVAINKIDKAPANIEKIRKQLSNAGLLVEEWGGKIVDIPISAKTGQNVDTLMDMILLQAELLELKADPDKPAQGVILESRLDPHKGSIATVLVQNGTLYNGDVFIAGCCIGKVKAMYDDQGKKTTEALPSYPVEILGFDTLPEAGDFFQVLRDESKARNIVIHRKNLRKERMLAKGPEQLSLEHLYSQIKDGLLKEFPLIVKGDAHGSIEALMHEIEKIKSQEIQVRIVHSSVGGINYSDVLLAAATNAIIIGFNVRAEAKARELAEREKVEILYYNIIYNFIEDIRKALIGMLEPEHKEITIGTAEVKKVFTISKTGTIAGCYVTSGKIIRNAQARLIRDNVVIHDGKIHTLKRFKEDATEVAAGYECGTSLYNYNDIKEDDILEVYRVEVIKPKILS
ncbi:MAG: hypothetical protein A2Y62_20665 [Candidatus Fischerbacteria bacterium RBG_13_37_8]|uniref:Translation initiation factor IF-2 n=1 Tax=Candidatus Fischerbacteria bacterium RBG_13_37_8 TaxID=1817863 RepID=A0A1F5VFY6_9BACT|nr:MAG: hypothetical protein A2Y62_20665 [Candidatus Fischerbacteria bacterium RBG_13_37_8]